MTDYNVVRVIDNNTIVINGGSSAGITTTATFSIRQLIPITDPNNGDEELGDVELVLAVATVVDVQVKFSVLHVSTLTQPDDVIDELWFPDKFIDTDCIAREDT